jgi:hypothetical protein
MGPWTARVRRRPLLPCCPAHGDRIACVDYYMLCDADHDSPISGWLKLVGGSQPRVGDPINPK